MSTKTIYVPSESRNPISEAIGILENSPITIDESGRRHWFEAHPIPGWVVEGVEKSTPHFWAVDEIGEINNDNKIPVKFTQI